jgi:hypothetical protein
LVLIQRLFDSPEGDLVLSIKALRVDRQQDRDAVTGSFCDLRGWNSSIEPGRQAGMS